VSESSVGWLLRSALLRSGRAVMPVSGGSMAPTLVGPDRVEIEAVPLSRVTVGDIVACEQQDRVVVHRVIETSPDGLWTAGDNHWFADPLVLPQAYLGRVLLAGDAPVVRSWAGHRRSAAARDGGLLVQPLVFHDGPRPGYPCPCHPVQTIPTHGVGSNARLLGQLAETLSTYDLVIAVQPAAVRPLDSLTEVAWPYVGRVALLIGGRLGEGASGTADFIPSRLTDLQVRPGPLGTVWNEPAAIAATLGQIEGVRCAGGS